jgi:hypothetical protein
MLQWLTAKVLNNNTVLYQLMVRVLVLTLCRNCCTVSVLVLTLQKVAPVSSGIICIVDDTVVLES